MLKSQVIRPYSTLARLGDGFALHKKRAAATRLIMSNRRRNAVDDDVDAEIIEIHEHDDFFEQFEHSKITLDIFYDKPLFECL